MDDRVDVFLSSGAVVTLFSHLPLVLPIAFSLVIAVMTAYSVAVNLDAKIRTMAKLHYGWSQMANDFGRLWNHTYADDAQTELRDLERRPWSSQSWLPWKRPMIQSACRIGKTESSNSIGWKLYERTGTFFTLHVSPSRQTAAISSCSIFLASCGSKEIAPARNE